MGKSESSLPLFRFAYIPEMKQRIEELAALAEPEDWDYKYSASEHTKPILYNYVQFTFARVKVEKKIICSNGARDELACFNTGLVTDNQEPVFGLFSKNDKAETGRPEKWILDGWARLGDNILNVFPQLPDLADYFDDPADLVFDNRLEMRTDLDHIIDDNRQRFPEPFRSMGKYQLRIFLDGAIRSARERVRRNYKAAVPQYYRGRLQLLLPICLSNPRQADLALVVERYGDSFYRSATCLTLDQAMNNARLIAKPDQDWLQP